MEGDGGRAVEKSELRAMMLAQRRAIPVALREQMNMALADLLLLLPEVHQAVHIHLYLSMQGYAEVDTAPVVDRLSRLEKELSVPVIRNGQLVSAVYHKGDRLRVGHFGQSEPDLFLAADESQIQVVLLPLLAFDGKGYRLGYGKGYYDRFLQKLSERGINPFRAGLAYDCQKIDCLPADHWDVPLDAVVHEKGVIRFN